MIYQKLSDFTKKNKKFLLLFFLGSLLLFTYKILYNCAEKEVNWQIRGLGYIALIIIITSLFLYSVSSKKIVFANIFLIFDLILLLEVICFFLLGMPSAFKKDFRPPNLPDDHIAKRVGTVLYNDSIYNAVLIKKKDTVYNVKYSIDHFHKRITPGHDSSKKEHSIFFGCSISFGVGLNDDQTLAYYFQKESGNFNSYNYGLSGHGANNVLACLQYQDLNKQIVEKKGAAFYIFFWDHIYRAIGNMSRYSDWVFNEPYYKMENDRLLRKKGFKEGRPVISKIYELIYQTNIVKYFKLDFPLKLNEKHLDLVSEMIKESKKEYQKQFPGNNFYCVIYPSHMDWDPEQFKSFKAFLTKKGIDYIDLTEYIHYGEKYTLGGDPHPNAATNELLAKELMNRYLKLQDLQKP